MLVRYRSSLDCMLSRITTSHYNKFLNKFNKLTAIIDDTLRDVIMSLQYIIYMDRNGTHFPCILDAFAHAIHICICKMQAKRKWSQRKCQMVIIELKWCYATHFYFTFSRIVRINVMLGWENTWFWTCLQVFKTLRQTASSRRISFHMQLYFKQYKGLSVSCSWFCFINIWISVCIIYECLSRYRRTLWYSRQHKHSQHNN